MTLDVSEFICRFLQHVLPLHFVKLRYFGLWASACRDKLALARKIFDHHLTAIGKPPHRALVFRRGRYSERGFSPTSWASSVQTPAHRLPDSPL